MLHNKNYKIMNYKGKIYKYEDFKLSAAKKKNEGKDTLSLNIWYNQFGLVYFKSVAL